MAIGTDLIFTDDFNRPDGPLGSNWPSVQGNIGIVSNRAQPTVATENAMRLAAIDMANVANADYAVEFQLGEPGNNVRAGAVLRWDQAQDNYYAICVEGPTEYSFRHFYHGANIFLINVTSDNVVEGDFDGILRAEVETLSPTQVVLRFKTSVGNKTIATYTHNTTDPDRYLIGEAGMAFYNNNAIANNYGAIDTFWLYGTSSGSPQINPGVRVEDIYQPGIDALVEDTNAAEIAVFDTLDGNRLYYTNAGSIVGGVLEIDSDSVGQVDDNVVVVFFYTDAGEDRSLVIKTTVIDLDA